MNIKQVDGYPKIQPQPENIPDFLRNERFATWIADPKPGNPGKFNKAPRNPKTGIRVGANDPSNFGTFDEAIQALGSGNYSGCGVLLTESSGITGIDIDDVRGQEEAVKDWIRCAVAGGAYCERSPSGEGVRLFVRGTLPGTGRKQNGLEIYNKDRFLTVTGVSLNKKPTGLIDGQSLIDEFLKFLPERQAKATQGKNRSQVVEADPKLIERIATLAEQAHPDLWIGWTALPKDVDRSQIDMSFACGTARIARVCGVTDEALPNVIEIVFNMSGLVRQKWTDRADYRNRTIAEAIARVNDEPVPSLLDFKLSVAQSNPLDKRDRVQLKLSDGLIQLSDTPPQLRKFVIGGLLPDGKSALFAGAGGTSKTQGALQFMVSVASGKSVFSREVIQGAALGIFAEDDLEELARRINATINTLNLSPQQKNAVVKRLRALSMVGLDARFTKPISGAIESTGFVDEIVRLCEELTAESGEPVRLIVIDHASLIHGGDFNSREDVAQTGRLINHIANVTGAAVLLLAHTRKGASTKDEEPTADDAAGSTARVDLVRSVILLRTMTDAEGRKLGVDPDKRKEYASLNVVKANYAPPCSAIWLHRRSVEGWGVGVLTEVDLKPKPKPLAGCDWKLRERIVDLVKLSPNLTQNKISLYAGVKGELRASRDKVTLEVDAMLVAGELVLVEPTAEEKKRLAIKGATAGFLRIGKEQS